MQRRDFLTATAATGGALSATDRAGVQADEKDDKISDVDRLSALVHDRYSALLDKAQLEDVRGRIADDRSRGQALAKHFLANGDEPVLAPSDVYRSADH